MKWKYLWLGLLFLVSSFSVYAQDSLETRKLFSTLKSDFPKPRFEVFEMAYKGYQELLNKNLLGDKNLLTLIDFSLSSKKRRLWIINLETKKIVEHSLVAHGKNSGQEFAKSFSNKPQSFQSSLGFYVTGETYHGKHGLSLYLHGVEEGFNDNALDRSIVIHGAKYVSFEFIEKHGRLGRSHGCPALPKTKHKRIIQLISQKTCLFIYFPSDRYLNNSNLVN